MVLPDVSTANNRDLIIALGDAIASLGDESDRPPLSGPVGMLVAGQRS
jgi:hypothetical protein